MPGRSTSSVRFAAGLLCLAVPATAAAACKEPETGTKRAPLLSPPLGKVVTGTGRLQFFSAPDAACRRTGVFVVPGDRLVAYAETNDGWTSVMYLGGAQPQGWVRSDRLRTTGTMGPSQ